MGVTVVCADPVLARSLVRKVLRAERLGATVGADVEVVAAGTPEAVVPATRPRVVLTPRATAFEALVALERGALAHLVDDDERRLADALAAGSGWGPRRRSPAARCSGCVETAMTTRSSFRW